MKASVHLKPGSGFECAKLVFDWGSGQTKSIVPGGCVPQVGPNALALSLAWLKLNPGEQLNHELNPGKRLNHGPGKTIYNLIASAKKPGSHWAKEIFDRDDPPLFAAKSGNSYEVRLNEEVLRPNDITVYKEETPLDRNSLEKIVSEALNASSAGTPPQGSSNISKPQTTTVVSIKLFYLSAHEDRDFARVGITFTVSPEIAREDFDAVSTALEPKAQSFMPHLSQVVVALYGLADPCVEFSKPQGRWICDDWRSHCPYIRYNVSVLTEEPAEKLGIRGASWVRFEVGEPFYRDSFVLQLSRANRADLNEMEKRKLIEFGEQVSCHVGELIRLTWPGGVQGVKVGAPNIVRHGDWGGEALVITAYPINQVSSHRHQS